MSALTKRSVPDNADMTAGERHAVVSGDDTTPPTGGARQALGRAILSAVAVFAAILLIGLLFGTRGPGPDSAVANACYFALGFAVWVFILLARPEPSIPTAFLAALAGCLTVSGLGELVESGSWRPTDPLKYGLLVGIIQLGFVILLLANRRSQHGRTMRGRGG